jgi:release factor glutamine methyltransferase
MHASDLSPSGGPRTVAAALREGAAALSRSGIEDAGGDVRRLLAAALDVPSAALLREPERVLSDAELAALARSIARRAGREPVSRILGERHFWGRPFTITQATLDPRPDTETLIAAALEIAAGEGWERPRILDVGTGSGCLLLTLLCELDSASGTGTDISAEALGVARDNAQRLGVAERASWLQADLLETVLGPFHMMVANPPYVRTSDIECLEAEVRNFDPRIALDGGADGLAFYRRLAARGPGVVPHGWIVMEVGYDQADAVVSIFSGIARQAHVHRDVTGKRRCVAVKTRGGSHE